MFVKHKILRTKFSFKTTQTSTKKKKKIGGRICYLTTACSSTKGQRPSLYFPSFLKLTDIPRTKPHWVCIPVIQQPSTRGGPELTSATRGRRTHRQQGPCPGPPMVQGSPTASTFPGAQTPGRSHSVRQHRSSLE